MVLENNNDFLNQNGKEVSKTLSTDLVDALKNMESLDDIKNELNINNRILTANYNSNKLSEESVVSFIKWLEYYKNQGWKVVFTGWFDMDIMDILSGDVVDLKIEDWKVKVSFVLDTGEIKTDEVELLDAFVLDFSFHCH